MLPWLPRVKCLYGPWFTPGGALSPNESSLPPTSSSGNGTVLRKVSGKQGMVIGYVRAKSALGHHDKQRGTCALALTLVAFVRPARKRGAVLLAARIAKARAHAHRRTRRHCEWSTLVPKYHGCWSAVRQKWACLGSSPGFQLLLGC
jgi:hypothetical protein